MGKEDIKAKPIRTPGSMEYQKRVAREHQHEEAAQKRMQEVWDMYKQGKAKVEVIERDPQGEITKYRFISPEDGSVLFYEDMPAFNAFLKKKESVVEQMREQTPKHMAEDLVDPLKVKLPGEKEGRGN